MRRTSPAGPGIAPLGSANPSGRPCLSRQPRVASPARQRSATPPAAWAHTRGSWFVMHRVSLLQGAEQSPWSPTSPRRSLHGRHGRAHWLGHRRALPARRQEGPHSQPRRHRQVCPGCCVRVGATAARPGSGFVRKPPSKHALLPLTLQCFTMPCWPLLSARRVWDLHTGTCRHVLQGHTGRINALQLSADGKLAATAGEDGTARVWDIRRGLCRRVLTVREGRRLISASSKEKTLCFLGWSSAIGRGFPGYSLAHGVRLLCCRGTRRGCLMWPSPRRTTRS